MKGRYVVTPRSWRLSEFAGILAPQTFDRFRKAPPVRNWEEEAGGRQGGQQGDGGGSSRMESRLGGGARATASGGKMWAALAGHSLCTGAKVEILEAEAATGWHRIMFMAGRRAAMVAAGRSAVRARVACILAGRSTDQLHERKHSDSVSTTSSPDFDNGVHKFVYTRPCIRVPYPQKAH